MIPSSTILLRLQGIKTDHQVQGLALTHIATRNKKKQAKINKALRHHNQNMAQIISGSPLGSVAVDSGQADFTYTMSIL